MFLNLNYLAQSSFYNRRSTQPLFTSHTEESRKAFRLDLAIRLLRSTTKGITHHLGIQETHLRTRSCDYACPLRRCPSFPDFSNKPPWSLSNRVFLRLRARHIHVSSVLTSSCGRKPFCTRFCFFGSAEMDNNPSRAEWSYPQPNTGTPIEQPPM